MDVMLLMLGSAVSTEKFGLDFSGYLGLGLISSLSLALLSSVTYALLFYS